MSDIFSSANLIALITLTVLEIILGIDNVIFIAILSGKLPKDQQQKARRLGLLFALITRILLLLSIGWIMRLQTDLFEIKGYGISGRDLILLIGGLFLIAKATFEIHSKLEGGKHTHETKTASSLKNVIFQIMLLDVVFSLDSVITAVGMVQTIWVMIAAVMIAVGIMIVFADRISHFIERHPTFKMLALSFLLMIGVVLVADGFGQHINKGYIYFAMFFSFVVELLNLKIRKTTGSPVTLKKPDF